jgi:hypothetical protein
MFSSRGVGTEDCQFKKGNDDTGILIMIVNVSKNMSIPPMVSLFSNHTQIVEKKNN